MTQTILPAYTVRAAHSLPGLGDGWGHPAWATAGVGEIKHFRSESSSHRPRTLFRLLHGPDGIAGIFQVDDRYVRSIRTKYLDPVWKDSCVEFFMQPRPDRGYFNLEMNAGGAHLCYYVEDPTRTPEGLKKFTPLPAELGQAIQIRSSLPKTIEPEMTAAVKWELNFFIPFAILDKQAGPLGKIGGQSWRGNFFKCAEEISHPHWASWSPVDELNFHLPRCFGTIHFE
jgi:hypothetical protein